MNVPVTVVVDEAAAIGVFVVTGLPGTVWRWDRKYP